MRLKKKICALAATAMMLVASAGSVVLAASVTLGEKGEYVKGSKTDYKIEVVSESALVDVKMDKKEIKLDNAETGKLVEITMVSEAPSVEPSVEPSVVPSVEPSVVPSITPSKDPVPTTEIPAATTEIPAATTEAPAATTEAPAATSEAPVATSEAPVATSEAPVATSEAPLPTPEVTVQACGDSDYLMPMILQAKEGMQIMGAGVSGNTYAVKLKSEYLDTLSAGEHTITLAFADNSVKDVTLVVKEAKDAETPKTGDTTPVLLFGTLLLMSGVVMILSTNKKKN